jgi:hypothetical protein
MPCLNLLAALVPVLAPVLALSAAPPAPDTMPETEAREPIIVTPPPTPAERRKALRDFTRQIIRPQRMAQPVARFFYPVCPEVRGLAPEDATAIAERIRENARMLGVGASSDPACVPTIRAGFMAPQAGRPESWLADGSAQLAHLASHQRAQVLAETGPVRAWNRVVVRDYFGQPLEVGRRALIDPISHHDPLITTEITGAAVLIARESAEGFTLAQLADYITVRALIGTGAPAADSAVPVRTILALFDDPDPPAGLTDFDRALVAELYNASRNPTARRVYHDIARAAQQAETQGQTGQ